LKRAAQLQHHREEQRCHQTTTKAYPTLKACSGLSFRNYPSVFASCIPHSFFKSQKGIRSMPPLGDLMNKVAMNQSMNNDEEHASGTAGPHGELLLRTLTMPADTNPSGDIFGGWLMSQMDMAGATILVRELTRGRCVTVAVDAFKFHQPVVSAN
jgi:hypothetical protein